MSTGHKKTHPYDVQWLTEHRWVFTDERVMSEFNRAYMCFRNYDIPYVAGYSKNGHIFYIDRHLPKFLRAGKKSFNTNLVLNHERMEAAIIHSLGWKYQPAHAMAEAYEDQIYDQMGLDHVLVEQAYEPYIKAIDHEKIRNVPADLDLAPYIDSKDYKLLSAIKRAQ
jgi:hypothetical protein